MMFASNRNGRTALAAVSLGVLLHFPSDAPAATAEHLRPGHRPLCTSATPIGADATRSLAPDAAEHARMQRGGGTPPHGHGGAADGVSQTAKVPDADCWLWPGAASRRCGENARVYLLQGHFYRTGRFEAQGTLPGRTPRAGRELVPVYRMDRLPANGLLQAVATPVIDAWRRRGWHVPGVQVDFDSPTAKLDRYAHWIRLENERFARSGTDAITSVTGLVDWLLNARPADLRALNRAAGVIAFMFYHRGRGIEPIDVYINALARSDLHFRLGLLPAQARERGFGALRSDRGYRGDIVFHGATASRE